MPGAGYHKCPLLRPGGISAPSLAPHLCAKMENPWVVPVAQTQGRSGPAMPVVLPDAFCMLSHVWWGRGSPAVQAPLKRPMFSRHALYTSPYPTTTSGPAVSSPPKMTGLSETCWDGKHLGCPVDQGMGSQSTSPTPAPPLPSMGQARESPDLTHADIRKGIFLGGFPALLLFFQFSPPTPLSAKEPLSICAP